MCLSARVGAGLVSARNKEFKMAKAIMIQGTGSGVGKSVIVAALCRIFLQDGYRVAPFKAQNMALNSFVTTEQGEIGRAQAVQAQACRIEPSVDMNPVLLKPTSHVGSQVIVLGKAIGNMSAMRYARYKPKLLSVVRKSFDRLMCEYDLVIIEGAGSPAEINLKSHDIVNMKMAEYADCPVVLVGDIDKGGVFAWLWGTLDLLPKGEKKRIKALLINKFRGDRRLLDSGIQYLEKKTGKKVLGVIPYFTDIKIPEEDSASLEMKTRDVRHTALADARQIEIAVIKLPHISNFTDFDALSNEKDVRLSYVDNKEQLKGTDIIIIPGTKNTIADLLWLKRSGLAKQILSAICYPPPLAKQALSATLIGICGGFQMLGKEVLDPWGIESSRKKRSNGLGVLNMVTALEKEKTVSQVKAHEITSGIEVSGYEIHHGRTKVFDTLAPMFEIVERKGRRAKVKDGALSAEGTIWGTYIHGIFDNDSFRRAFLERIAVKNNKSSSFQRGTTFNQEEEFNKLAQLVRGNIDRRLLYSMIR